MCNACLQHPRVKETVAKRLARAAWGLIGPTKQPQSVPKFAGCRLSSAGKLLLFFDQKLLSHENVTLQPPEPGKVPLQLKMSGTSSGNNSGWIYADTLSAVNSTTISVTFSDMGSKPLAVRYAWGDNPCCPGLNKSTAFCPPAACPIVTSSSKEPGVPFWAHIEGNTCRCDLPWDCGA